MATVFFLLDAFRWDYLDARTTPFLHSCAAGGHHYQRVVPGFGFCERAEILTGKKPAETGYFTAIGYAPEMSPYRSLQTALRVLDLAERLIPIRQASRLLRRLVRRMAAKQPHRMNPYRIPLDILHCFTLTEDYYDHRDPGAFDVPTLFRLLEQRGESYFYDSYTSLNFPRSSSDGERLAMVLDAAKDRHSLYMIYNSTPDHFGHLYGAGAPETVAALRRMDGELEKFLGEFERHRPGSSYVFLGDHGMVEVEKRLDVGAIVRKAARSAGLRIRRDYLYFLDSTLCRLWFLNERALRRLSGRLLESETLRSNGMFIDEAVARRESIPFGDRRYGDLIWWAAPGILVSPDFFHRRGELVRGMHGYDPRHQSSRGTCIVYGERHKPAVTPEIKLTGIYGILQDCLFPGSVNM